jgi:excisionase family DNA binding protein
MVTTLAAPRLYWRQLAAPTPGDQPSLLTITEACAELRVSRWSVYQLIRNGKLATITIGRRRLVPAAAIRTLIDGEDQ